MNQHSEPVVINKADGTVVTLKRVRAEDRYLTYRSEFRTSRKLLLLEDLTIRGVPRSEWAKEFDALNSRRLTDAELIRWIDDPAGQYVAIRLSLSIDNPKATDADVSALGLSDDQLHEAAAGVMGLRLVPVKPPLTGSAPETTSTSGAPATDSAADST